MRKKEVKFWTLVSKIKQSKHILDIALEFDKNSITAQKYNKIIGDQEQELYNYIIECDIPLKVIPTYFDNIRNLAQFF